MLMRFSICLNIRWRELGELKFLDSILNENANGSQKIIYEEVSIKFRSNVHDTKDQTE